MEVSGSKQVDLAVQVAEDGSHDLLVVGRGLIERPDSNWHLVTRHHVIRDVAVDVLHDAMQDKRRCCASLPEYIEVAPDDAPEGALGPAALNTSSLLIAEDGVWVEAAETIVVLSEAVDPEVQRLLDNIAGPELTVRAFVTDAYGYEIDDPIAEEAGAPGPTPAAPSAAGTLTVRVAARRPADQCVGDLLVAAERLSHVIAVLGGGKPQRPDVAAHLLRSRFDDLLVGVVEGSWFEAKGQPYNLTGNQPASDAAKQDLACDIAAFANSHEAALLVIGARTTRSFVGDAVVSVVPVPNLTARDPDRYSKVLEEWIHPPLLGLRVELLERDNGSILMIHIPVQPSNLRPFLVTRGWRGDRVSTRQITLATRVGDRNRYQSAAQLHAALAAGLALLSNSHGAVDS